ncbi:ABC transporter ATP-binding protein [Hydromonas duriensis]|uniref:Lipopolysaccharide transport system ATP-binding protein n=1 Tax=Hydromonas duriensis TaxID=1527608 RepID=A0A4R6Y857_9BURK|nr:ABC transporter ATP-binding protein [Hydromonas duriensis]TDR31564.1 lipopolysaccharide transport system ATP-binding protein [Hydromonas duriensis]
MTAYISTENLGVHFPVFNSSHRSLKKSIISISTGGLVAKDSRDHVVVRALEGINLNLKQGDRVGLLGHNGSGKTTLLRALSGVYAPTEGKIEVKGRIATLLDINLGMDGEATGYENIRIRGLLMGLSLDEIEAKIDEIAEFTDLGEYLDMPMRTYSSGMNMRVGFAVSTAIDADIVLMDEWLSVGDAEFQNKAAKRLNDMVERASILVLASHSIDLLKKTCNKIIHMEHGRIVGVDHNDIVDLAQ